MRDLVSRLDLPETAHVQHYNYFYNFNREELLIYVLTKLAYGLPHTVMADMIFGGDSSRWSKGYNYLMKYIDDKFIDLIGINSLQIWASFFPAFSEAVRRKYCYYWDKANESGPEIDNPFIEENTCNMCGLLDVSVNEIYQLGSGPIGEGEKSQHRPHSYIK